MKGNTEISGLKRNRGQK